MEPLVPALPSTNEYEETATDNGKRCTLQTHTTQPHAHTARHRPLESHMGPLCRKRHMDMHNAQTESVNWAADAPIPPSVLSPWRHQPPQHAKNMPSVILPKDTNMPVSVGVCPCVWLCVGEAALCDITETEPQTHLVSSLREAQLEVISLAPWGLSLLTPPYVRVYSWKLMLVNFL